MLHRSKKLASVKNNSHLLKETKNFGANFLFEFVLSSLCASHGFAASPNFKSTEIDKRYLLLFPLPNNWEENSARESLAHKSLLSVHKIARNSCVDVQD